MNKHYEYANTMRLQLKIEKSISFNSIISGCQIVILERIEKNKGKRSSYSKEQN